MQRLIDADALITAVLKNAIDYAVLYGDSEMHRLLVQVIAHQPTIEAVPVIRCRECKYLRFTGTVWKCQNSIVMMLCEPNDYCSRAERRGEEE